MVTAAPAAASAGPSPAEPAGPSGDQRPASAEVDALEDLGGGGRHVDDADGLLHMGETAAGSHASSTIHLHMRRRGSMASWGPARSPSRRSRAR